MSGVYIVGAGIHPFGRTPERTGLLQGVFAVRQALGRAGLDWRDIQFAYGGSDAAGKADTMVSEFDHEAGVAPEVFDEPLPGLAVREVHEPDIFRLFFQA